MCLGCVSARACVCINVRVCKSLYVCESNRMEGVCEIVVIVVVVVVASTHVWVSEHFPIRQTWRMAFFMKGGWRYDNRLPKDEPFSLCIWSIWRRNRRRDVHSLFVRCSKNSRILLRCETLAKSIFPRFSSRSLMALSRLRSLFLYSTLSLFLTRLFFVLEMLEGWKATKIRSI